MPLAATRCAHLAVAAAQTGLDVSEAHWLTPAAAQPAQGGVSCSLQWCTSAAAKMRVPRVAGAGGQPLRPCVVP